MFPYESPNLQQDIDEVWEMIRPLYEELHAYVRRKLRDLYGPEKIGTHAPLPAHILGIRRALDIIKRNYHFSRIFFVFFFF